MDSDNWVVQNLQNALDTWNTKMAEVWSLLTMSPQSFKGGGIWNVITQINGAVKAIGLALLVLFFLVGVVKTCGSLTDIKRPEHALKLFIRFPRLKLLDRSRPRATGGFETDSWSKRSKSLDGGDVPRYFIIARTEKC